MPLIILLALLIVLIYTPQWWARRTFKRYANPQTHISGTGGELAEHLLERFEMPEVGVETTDEGGDHYDPASKMVRLSPSNYNNNSLTAVAVAAHEVGHAIQHHNHEKKLELRTNLVGFAQKAEKMGAVVMMLLPVAVLITRSPVAGLIFFAAGILSIGTAALVHLVTLPVEWDASFGKALPILQMGYINAEDQQAVRKILKAAALTYVAASLASLFNVWRWLVLLRR